MRCLEDTEHPPPLPPKPPPPVNTLVGIVTSCILTALLNMKDFSDAPNMGDIFYIILVQICFLSGWSLPVSFAGGNLRPSHLFL